MQDLIVGIDYSMTTPAMCVLDESQDFSKSQFYFLSSRKRDIPWKNILVEQHKEYNLEIERFHNISEYFTKYLYALKLMGWNVKVFIEDYSMGSKGKVFNIAENTGVLKYKLFQLKIEYTTIPPTVIKKYASGKGNADKDMMYEAFLKRGNPDITKFYYDKVGVKITSPVSDIVDSYFIALYGANEKKI